MGRIILDDMEFYAFHGCMAEEQIIGGKFLVTISIEADTSAAEATDMLSKTINYQEVYALTKKEMEKKSKLLEHVASRIASAVKNRFLTISRIGVKVTKLNPPVGGKMAGVSIYVEKTE
ncbi:MAG TPA: dihydroneopterin aldolase [Bacteroidales bacterium]|nr:dihydroneopterin aldolase [Bacteroidales bacterium]